MLQSGLSPLHLAAQEDRVSAAEVLTKHDANLDQQTKVENTHTHTHHVMEMFYCYFCDEVTVKTCRESIQFIKNLPFSTSHSQLQILQICHLLALLNYSNVQITTKHLHPL